ncbi:MAG TPA: hypothetical protein VGJ86_16910 [Acidimicrobiales bacterium]
MRHIRALVLSSVLVLATACAGERGSEATAPAGTTRSESMHALKPLYRAASGPFQNLPAGPNYNKTSGPSGAGCKPGSSTKLPEGWWAGEIKSVSGATAQFDLVCWYQGAAATKAAAQHRTTAENDYYVTNDSPKLRKVDFGSSRTPATCVGNDNHPFGCTVGDVLAIYPGVGRTVAVDGNKEAVSFPYVWVHSNGSKADYAYVQFTP